MGTKSSYVKSVLRPFETACIKAPYDFPINTSVVSNTYEIPLTAVLGNGAGVIPNG